MITIHDMPEEDIRSGKYYDAWHWLWSKEQERKEKDEPKTDGEQTVN